MAVVLPELNIPEQTLEDVIGISNPLLSNIDGLPQEAMDALQIANVEVDPYVVSASTLAMLTSSKRPVDLILDFGPPIKFVESPETSELPSTVTNNSRLVLPTGIFMPVSELEVVINPGLEVTAVVAPTGRKRESMSLLTLQLRFAKTRTHTGIKTLSNQSFG